jgi:nucleotide-binding universal stress UspA family protein
MTLDSRSRRIVVGYDGSPASRAALAHAAERVVARAESRANTETAS